MRNIVFEEQAFQDFTQWALEDKKIYRKIVDEINDIQRNPFSGIGKPEPLKYNLRGCWSRRITDKHRLVYRITDAEIILVSCKFHYE